MARAAIIRTDRYNQTAIILHWTIAALIIYNLISGLFHESLLKGLPLMGAHKAVGMTVLLLTIVRIGIRFAHTPPPPPANVPAWSKLVAKSTHFVFYVLLLVMPLSGWVMVSGGRVPRPVSYFGLFDIPYLPVSRAAGGIAHESHEVLGYLFAALVVMHIAAAFWHHYSLRNGTLSRMAPWTTPRGA